MNLCIKNHSFPAADGMTQWVECLLNKLEDLKLFSQHPCKNQAQSFTSLIHGLGIEDRGTLGSLDSQ